jgi:hypothetical protein
MWRVVGHTEAMLQIHSNEDLTQIVGAKLRLWWFERARTFLLGWNLTLDLFGPYYPIRQLSSAEMPHIVGQCGACQSVRIPHGANSYRNDEHDSPLQRCLFLGIVRKSL